MNCFVITSPFSEVIFMRYIPLISSEIENVMELLRKTCFSITL